MKIMEMGWGYNVWGAGWNGNIFIVIGWEL